MFLNVSPRPGGRKYLSIVQGYRENGKVKKKTIESIGYLDELEKEYDDPIAHFKQVAIEMTNEKNKEDSEYTFSISKEESLALDTDNSFNFGYTAFSKIYHELEIDSFFHNKQRHSKETYDANIIMKLLVFSRLLFPGSKKSTFEGRNSFFEKDNYSLDDVYRCLSFLSKNKEDLQVWMNERIKSVYGRNSHKVYYDVTNYYFEIDEPDDFRKKGYSKEHRTTPIVQMGMFIDSNGIPITYQLFDGNTNDCKTYIDNFRRLKNEFNLGKVITVADKGMSTGDNIWYTTHTPTDDGYVFSLSVRGSDKELKNYVLDSKGYTSIGEDFKCKSRLYPRTIYITTQSNNRVKKTVDEKQVVFYSKKYADKAAHDREMAVIKARDLIANPSKYNRATSVGAAKYVSKLSFDEETGSIITPKSILELDLKAIEEEKKYDGYYVIVTSEHKMKDTDIIDIYRGLWKIEESFKITKSELKARPVYVSVKDHIEGHFLTCFVALTLARLLQYKCENKYSVGAMLDSLRKSTCTHIKENLYLFSYYDKILETIGEKCGIPFNKKVLSLKEIKKILADTKK